MTSELRVDNLKGSTTGGSINVLGEGTSATTNLQQGLAKQWCNFVGSSASVNDSFNTASVTDNGTGDFSPQITNDMSSANYNVSCMIKPTSSQSNQTLGRVGNIRYNEDPTAGGYRVIAVTCADNTGTVGPEDNDKTMTTAHGDLA